MHFMYTVDACPSVKEAVIIIVTAESPAARLMFWE